MKKLMFLLIALFIANGVCFAQQRDPADTESAFDVVLNIVVGSNSPSSRPMPAELSATAKKLKSIYGYSDYRPGPILLGRAAAAIESKSAIAGLSDGPPAFVDWSLRGIRSSTDGSIEIESFRFYARMPIEMGADSKSTVFEPIGLTLGKLVLRESEATVVGSLSTAKSDESMFLILTVARTALR